MVGVQQDTEVTILNKHKAEVITKVELKMKYGAGRQCKIINGVNPTEHN
jgi:hypothetical protein